MSLAAVMDSLSRINLNSIEGQKLLYESSRDFFSSLDYAKSDPVTLVDAEQNAFIQFLLKNITPKAALLEERVYSFLIDHLTPKLFLSKREFAESKRFFYISSLENLEDLIGDSGLDECFYESPSNLTDLGKLCVYTELKRLELVYQQEYANTHNPNTGLEEQLVTPEIARALYLYMTNFFTKINGPLRCGGVCDCYIKHFIALINRGIERLSRVLEFQLNPDEHTLTRYINLPEHILNDVIKDLKSMNCFLDRAFLSTSFNKDGAVEFSEDANVVLIIHSNGDCRGAKINGLSPFPREGECLYPPGTKFACRSIECIDVAAVKKWIVHVTAVSLSTVATSVMVRQRAITRFKSPIMRRHSSLHTAVGRVNTECVALSVRRRNTLAVLPPITNSGLTTVACGDRDPKVPVASEEKLSLPSIEDRFLKRLTKFKR